MCEAQKKKVDAFYISVKLVGAVQCLFFLMANTHYAQNSDTGSILKECNSYYRPLAHT